MLVAGPAHAAEAVPAAPDPALEARVHKLAAELRCLVCQNQSLADSNADLAVDLKNQVREQLRAGRSERDVLDYMTERYGDFVLYRPPVKASTLLLWGGPLLLLLIGALLYWRSLRASQAVPAAQAMSAEDAARADRLLRGADETPPPGR
ncbi:cytochrome c-type biogenesis protein [Pseudorhodoferax sp.]|uniref:cytochrome c-type biogenesis protein n=1 Tax=Pseudorhodoferax sp. TaxID=1993553 RepID=UPI002DD64E63|nr:cytochrome c-type biogenesis protein [Pseudorhodoferax sp.]